MKFKIALVTAVALTSLHTEIVSAELTEDQVRHLVVERALAHGANPDTLLCVVNKESRFKPSARGRQGEYGLAQWLPPVEDNAWGQTTAYANGIDIAAEYERGNPDAPYYDADSIAELFARGRVFRQQHWYNTIRGCE